MEKVECPYVVNVTNEEENACLNEGSFIECSGSTVKIREGISSNSQSKPRKPNIEFWCLTLERKMYSTNISGVYFIESICPMPQTNTLTYPEEVKKNIFRKAKQNGFDRKKVLGKLVVFYEWPNVIKDKVIFANKRALKRAPFFF